MGCVFDVLLVVLGIMVLVWENVCVLWWGSKEVIKGKWEVWNLRVFGFWGKGFIDLLGGDSVVGERNLGLVCVRFIECVCVCC